MEPAPGRSFSAKDLPCGSAVGFRKEEREWLAESSINDRFKSDFVKSMYHCGAVPQYAQGQKTFFDRHVPGLTEEGMVGQSSDLKFAGRQAALPQPQDPRIVVG